ncbi:hypothetical protein AMTR_s00274p00011610 [Amborella trichopoda]|uniref:Uncharacterized protein n=1 Tax=Amborella trichopoda TaxID=13333 RepID=W1P4F9_AMBTC|nr:hypothetical protein AMTR_s00274p00011610 [Amborella trichopoda]
MIPLLMLGTSNAHREGSNYQHPFPLIGSSKGFHLLVAGSSSHRYQKPDLHLRNNDRALSNEYSGSVTHLAVSSSPKKIGARIIKLSMVNVPKNPPLGQSFQVKVFSDRDEKRAWWLVMKGGPIQIGSFYGEGIDSSF